jgi:glutamine amidotransferase
VRLLEGENLKVPHIGWNQIAFRNDCRIFTGLPQDTYVYFDHSYYADPEDREVVAAETEYGVRFASALWKDNVYATQFHPEKSQKWGLKMLENFGRL